MFPRFQTNNLRDSFATQVSFGTEICYRKSKPVKKESNMLNVDQFFSEEHNLRYGHVDTSPLAASTVSAASHVSPVGQERQWPADTPDDVIMSSVVSKSCQTLSEVSELKNLMPIESDYQKVESELSDDSTDAAPVENS